jgi:hypothetical protein
MIPEGRRAPATGSTTRGLRADAPGERAPLTPEAERGGWPWGRPCRSPDRTTGGHSGGPAERRHAPPRWIAPVGGGTAGAHSDSDRYLTTNSPPTGPAAARAQSAPRGGHGCGRIRLGVNVGSLLCAEASSGTDRASRRRRICPTESSASQSITHAMSDLVLESALTCPACGHVEVATMPTDACQFFYECPSCHAMLRPKPGDCCVFCSYGSVACPPKQAGGDCSCVAIGRSR